MLLPLRFLRLSLVLGLLCAVPAAGEAPRADQPWVDLFDGESLDGWVANLGKRGDDNSQPIEQIFTVTDGKIHVYRNAPNRTKQFSANLRTTEKFSRFHLQVEYRWQDNRFQPRHAAVRDAGILFHIHSEPNEVWPPSVEMQLGGGEPGAPYVTGDIWIIGNTRAKSPAKKDGTAYYYTPGEIITEFGGRHPANEGMQGANYTSIPGTKPHGEWNLAEVIVDGSQRAEYYLNGVLVNEVSDMRFLDANGEWQPLESGYISLQAEWAELQYRTVRIKKL
ncbi:MAG: hypothetical protein SynsKO_26490 [Synoicihabitans sp.]